MDDRNVLTAALTFGDAVEVDHHGPRAVVRTVEQRVNLEAIEALVAGLDRFDELSELFVLADVRPAAVGRPFMDLGGTRRVLPAYKRGAAIMTPAQVIALRSRDVRVDNAIFPVDTIDGHAIRQVDDSDGVVNTLIHDHDCASSGVIDGVAVDVVLLVDEPPFDGMRSFRIDLGQPDEVAVTGIGQQEHPTRRPPDLTASAGIRQQPSHGAVPLQDVWFRPTSKYLVDDRPHSVGIPILPGPKVTWSRPGNDFAGHEVELAEADIAPAAGVPAEADASAVRMQGDALMDGLQVLGQRAELTIGLDHAQLPGLVAASVVAHEQAKIGPRVRQGSVSGIGHRPRRASSTVEMEGLLVTVDIGGERETPIRSGQRPGGANDSQEPREIRIIG